MRTDDRTALLRLGDMNLTVANPSEDIRGRKVIDQAGEELGSVDDLFVDDREKKVRFLQVASGGFLGLGATTFLIPVDAITRIEEVAEGTVHIDRTREHVAGAPRYDPELAQPPDYYSDLYGYYGLPPYWGAGYLYPRFPYYPG